MRLLKIYFRGLYLLYESLIVLYFFLLWMICGSWMFCFFLECGEEVGLFLEEDGSWGVVGCGVVGG